MKNCCCKSAAEPACCGAWQELKAWHDGVCDTPLGSVPRVRTQLTWRDRLGGCLVRWNFRRMDYAVSPGLYAVGRPTSESNVFVSANYKLSFDVLRAALNGINGWILVLDTKGINVWCAAGKGTFGTAELVRRVLETGLDKVVSHRALIVPQLGATGVAAHEVFCLSGFKVIYGPVRAADIPEFLAAGLRATPAMRRVDFPLWDRLKVVPVEAMLWLKPALAIMFLLFILAGLNRHGYDPALALGQWFRLGLAVFVTYLAGILFVPLLLPWLPGRSFAIKGAMAGLGASVLIWCSGGYFWIEGMAITLLSVAICSFLGLNFTGCTTYTSPSGVRREMKWALPLQIAGTIAGGLLWLGARFV